MPSKYSVIQYVPNPIADERINIGVIGFGEGGARARFLSDWTRVRHFGLHDVTFLKDFANRFTLFVTTEAVQLQLGEVTPVIPAGVLSEESEWMNSIQITEPKASLKPVDDLMGDIAVRFLTEPIRRQREIRDRRAAAAIAARDIRRVLEMSMSQDAEDLLKKRARIQGRLQPHRFDVVVANGVAHFAAEGLSFEVPETGKFRTELDATAWKLKDVKERDPGFPLAVVALPPRENSPHHKHMSELLSDLSEVYRQIGAEVLLEGAVTEWTARQVARLPLLP